MTIYTYDFDNIIDESSKMVVGWFNNQTHNHFECVLAIRNILQNHGHSLNIKLYKGPIGEYKQADPIIREGEMGYYITDQIDELNYAYISKNMNCAKLCINAILKVMQV